MIKFLKARLRRLGNANILSILLNKRFKYSLIVSDSYFGWLGLDYEKFKAILTKRSIYVIALSSIKASSPEDSRGSCPQDLCRKLAEYPALVESEKCRPDKTLAFSECIDKWASLITRSIATISSNLKRIEPRGVVVVQGFEPNNASLRAASFLLSIPCLAIENSSRPDRLIWDNIASYACVNNLAGNFFFGYRHFVSDSEALAYRDNFTTETFCKKSEEHQSGSASRAQVKEAPETGYLLFLGQVFTDAATISNLCDWQSPLALIEKVVDWCVAKKVGIIIKLHPKEIKGRDTVTLKRYNNLTFRMINQMPLVQSKLFQCDSFIDSDNLLNTYDLIKSSALVVTLSSQAGLEAAIFGKPVVVGGRSSYSGLGFTYDAPNPALLEPQLDLAWSNKNSDHSLEASRFAAIYFEKYCISKTEEKLADLCVETFG